MQAMHHLAKVQKMRSVSRAQQRSCLHRLHTHHSTPCRQVRQQLHKCAAGTADAQPFDALAAWLLESGGNVGQITAGDCVMGDVTVRGLVASNYLESGTPIISVPISSTLRDDKVPEAYPGAPWNANLAAYLLEERSKGSSSKLAPYLATLPKNPNCPLLMSHHVLQEVQYEPAIQAISSYQSSAKEMYSSWCEVRGVKGLQQYSWEEWCWALHMVQSRSIRLAISGCKVMIPGIDLLNHGGHLANGQLVLGKTSWQMEAEQAIMFVTTEDIEEGQQVLWSYGQRGNDDFFVYHGFALPDNSDEDVVLFNSVHQLVEYAVHMLPSLWILKEQEPAEVITKAEEAAVQVAEYAAAHCPSAAIQGTSSSLLVSIGGLTSCLGDGGLSSYDKCTEKLLAVLKENGVELYRRLASFKLHSREWGEPSCLKTIPELVIRVDGALDVRIPAVLAILQDLASEVSQQQPNHCGKYLRDLLNVVIRRKCEELLDAFATDWEHDGMIEEELAEGNGSGDLLAAAVQYRLLKKQLLLDQIDQLHDTSAPSPPIGGWQPAGNSL